MTINCIIICLNVGLHKCLWLLIRWSYGGLMGKRTSDNRITKATTLSSCGTNIFLLVIMIQILRSWYMIFRMKSSQIMICQSSNLCWAFRFQLCAVRIGDWVLIQYDSMSFPGEVKWSVKKNGLWNEVWGRGGGPGVSDGVIWGFLLQVASCWPYNLLQNEGCFEKTWATRYTWSLQRELFSWLINKFYMKQHWTSQHWDSHNMQPTEMDES